MADLQEPKYAVDDKTSLHVIGNYLFTDKCTSCKKYMEENGKHHCTSIFPLAASYKSIENNFGEYTTCRAYKKTSSKNEGKFHQTFLLFIITIGVVIYLLLTRPIEMWQRYWFYGVLGIGLTVIFLIHYLIVGNILLSHSQKKEKLGEGILKFTSIVVFISYFFYHDVTKTLSNISMFVVVIWIVLLIILIQGIKLLNILFHIYGMRIPIFLLPIIAIIVLSVIFAVIDYVLGVLLMVAGPHSEKLGAEASKATGILP
jgi:hypothetical protein